ncbi:MAG: efflux RND transporter periplasmic adaptor subunit [Pedobacter sp.]
MNKKIIIGIILTIALCGGFLYRFTNLKSSASQQTEKMESDHKVEKAGEHDESKEKEKKNGHDEHGEPSSVKMTVDMQKQNGILLAPAKKQRLGGVINATGKVEANADRIAHVAPRIPGKIVSVKASLGDSISAGQALATLDSVELAEAINRYHQSRTRFALAQTNMERIKGLVEKKIAARKEILQAETEFKNAQTEMQTDEDRLSLYGISTTDHKDGRRKNPPLMVRSPISGVITEKHAIVGELSDPSKSLYTVADLSTVWVMIDINEKDLAAVRKGQAAIIAVGAFPDQKFRGRINHIADVMDQATRTVKARIEVVNPGRKLKPEMFATAELALPANSSPILAVPEDALQDVDSKKVIFITDEKGIEFTPRTVEPGRVSGGMVEIVSGLKEGERYAIKGSFILKSELKKGELEGDAH